MSPKKDPKRRETKWQPVWFSVSLTVYQIPPGTELGKKQTWCFLKKSRSWETTGLNLRDSGPGCDHHFIAWCPCQLPSILPACVGSPLASQLHAWLLLSSSFPLHCKLGTLHRTGHSWPGFHRFRCKWTGSITDCQTCSVCPQQRWGWETAQWRQSCNVPLCQHGISLAKSFKVWSRWKKLPLKDKCNPLLGHYLQLMAGLGEKSQISACVKNIRDNSGLLSYLSHQNESNFCWACATNISSLL